MADRYGGMAESDTSRMLQIDEIKALGYEMVDNQFEDYCEACILVAHGCDGIACNYTPIADPDNLGVTPLMMAASIKGSHG